MAVKIGKEFLSEYISESQLDEMRKRASDAYATVTGRSGESNDYLGWLDLPAKRDSAETDEVIKAAERIRASCDIFIVIGIGGSYLGARAAIEFCKTQLYNELNDGPRIYFCGNDLSESHIKTLLNLCEGHDVCVNVISKSGTTTEPAVSFRLIRALLDSKYGVGNYADRVYVTTDKSRGSLKKLADREGFTTFVIPDDVGGRYSVLTPVGLLPIAVAGIDVKSMFDGAKDIAAECAASEKCSAVEYAILRNILRESGKSIEVLASYDPALTMTGEWFKQLYGESEGKDGLGLFPASVVYTTDLHSMGQYMQQGTRNVFETVIQINNDGTDLSFAFDSDDADGMNHISGMPICEINRAAFTATAISHNDGGVPNIILSLDKRNAYSFGALVYFFEFACAVSGYILGVNPFNQPGVEGYKKNMFALLGRPGKEFDIIRESLNKRLNK